MAVPSPPCRPPRALLLLVLLLAGLLLLAPPVRPACEGTLCEGAFYLAPDCACTPCPSGCTSCTAPKSTDQPAPCTACSLGHFHDTSAGACLPCHRSCAACTSASRSEFECAACFAPNVLFNGHCVPACPPGTALAPGRQCLPCSGGGHCAACHHLDTGSEGEATICDACQPGWYTDEPDEHGHQPPCTRCHVSCATCAGLGPTACTSCVDGLLLDPATGRCGRRCPEGTSPTEAAECVACPAGCLACLEPGTPQATCTGCLDGWFAAPLAPGLFGVACDPCPEDCLTCSSGAECDRCTVGRRLLLGDFSCAPEGDACPAAGHAPSPPESPLCPACHPLCDTCSGPGPGDCLSCRAGLLPASSSITGPSFEGEDPAACHSPCGPFLASPPSPDSASSDSQAPAPCSASCASASCEVCTGPLPGQCLRCRGDVAAGVAPAAPYLWQGDCREACPEGTAPGPAGVCLACHPTCAECTGQQETQCTRCIGGLSLDPAAGMCRRRCLDGTVAIDSEDPRVGAQCQPCRAAGCAACPPADLDACLRCAGGLLLHPPGAGGPCQAGPCPEGYFTLSGRCEPCAAGCRQCSGPEVDRCDLCTDGRAPSPGATCPDGNRPGACLEGYFPQGDACAPCASTCATCDGPSGRQCTGCAPGLLLQEGQCRARCAAGTFHPVSPGPGDGSSHAADCLPCDTNACLECEDFADRCTACHEPLLLHASLGTCVEACPEDGTRLDAPHGRRCVSCDPSCRTCRLNPDYQGGGLEEDPDGPPAELCLVCHEAFELIDGSCHSRCRDGFYISSLDDRGSPVCAACPHLCSTCARNPNTSSPTAICVTCLSDLLLHGGSCVQSCPPVGFVEDTEGRSCVPCQDRLCDRCDPPDGTNCQRCILNAFLHEGVGCVESCPAGFFGSSPEGAPGVCLSCAEGCLQCSGRRTDQCTKWNEERELYWRTMVIGVSVGCSILLCLMLGTVVVYLTLRQRRRAAKAAAAGALEAAVAPVSGETSPTPEASAHEPSSSSSGEPSGLSELAATAAPPPEHQPPVEMDHSSQALHVDSSDSTHSTRE
ncbi:hypothetical protein H696_05045 [Fonticula alba]|uniref:EGF-like domain-containing protein n=1 Tax=Fonticula alba TaxID=691883 RepID=A0A058Z3P4_FONAL|nr:hypothetical protein H696_05045 [Fonticula alba]KCV68761.1 hypothetical protein H696_05045 [Fonticula alba]|eukprot:XP_009497193.1 hypothetical protein H696_05045 [Fonticula alba]